MDATVRQAPISKVRNDADIASGNSHPRDAGHAQERTTKAAHRRLLTTHDSFVAGRARSNRFQLW